MRSYMAKPATPAPITITSASDYLSSSRKRLASQLISKGGILKTWARKQAVAVHNGFYESLSPLPEVPKERTDLA